MTTGILVGTKGLKTDVVFDPQAQSSHLLQSQLNSTLLSIVNIQSVKEIEGFFLPSN